MKNEKEGNLSEQNSHTTDKKSHGKKHNDKVHKNLKPFDCEICKQCFINKDALKRHINKVHSNSNDFDMKSEKEENLSEQNSQTSDTLSSDGEIGSIASSTISLEDISDDSMTENANISFTGLVLYI